jgi:hypothetical protein
MPIDPMIFNFLKQILVKGYAILVYPSKIKLKLLIQKMKADPYSNRRKKYGSNSHHWQ